MLRPNYAWAVQVSPRTMRGSKPRPRPFLAAGQRGIRGYSSGPPADRAPARVVVHENRGLSPYIEEWRAALGANFIAFAPDGLTWVGGYPGDDEKGAGAFEKIDPAKMTEDFVAAAQWLKAGRTAPGGSVRSVSATGVRWSTAWRLPHGRGPQGGRRVLRPARGGPTSPWNQGADQRAIRRRDTARRAQSAP